MEIKEGMYVRIEPYYCSYDVTFISKITSVRDKEIVIKDIYEGWRGLTNVAYKDEIKKASYNIIDLIEEGDYVNGLKVTNIGIIFPITKSKIIYCRYELKGNIMTWGYSNKDIKSVVTKEQFENMKYEVQND